MTGVQLAASQYKAYDMDGTVLASRAVRAHATSARSEEGQGICFTLRTGEELGNTDGIGVQLTISEAQLDELGYVRAEPIADQVTAIVDLLAGMPDEVVEFEEELTGFEFGPAAPMPEDYAFCPMRGMVRPIVDHSLTNDLEVFCTILDEWVGAKGHMPNGVPALCIDKRAVKSL